MHSYTLDQIRENNGASVASVSADVQQKVYELGAKQAGKAKKNAKADAEKSKKTGTRKVVPDSELTAEQREAKEYAAKVGYNVIFEDNPEWENGFIDKKGNIHISKNTKDPVRVVMIHELTHYAEKSAHYATNFANPILDSQSFQEWLAEKGFASNRAYNDYLRDTRQAMAKKYNNPEYIIDEDGANKEMLAQFCGEVLFADDTSGLRRFLAQMNEKQRKTFSDHIRAFIRWIKNLFADKTTKAENARIAAIEDFEKRFTDTLKSVESSENRGKSYSTDDSYLENKKKKDYNDFHPALSKQQWAKFYNETDVLIEVDALSDRANIYFAVGAKPSDSVLVIFDYNKGKKTRTAFKVYRNASVFNDKLAELEVMYYNGTRMEELTDEIARAVQRKELLSFDSKSHHFGFSGSSERRPHSVSKGSINGHRGGAGRNRIQNSGLVSSGSGHRAVTDEKNNKVSYSINDDSYTRTQAQKLADGEIDLAEFNARIKEPKENPATIARLTPQDANTTPKLKGKGVVEGVDDSNFYESVMESDIFSAEFKEEASKKDFLKKYKGVTNDETMLAAKQLLDEGGQKYVNQWFGKTPNQMSAEDVAVGVILMSRYNR